MQRQLNVQDVTINDLSISSALAVYDITPYIVELNIEENLFKTSMTGSVVLSDSYNIPAKFPIVGEEHLNIDIALSGIDERGDETQHTVKTPKMYVNSIDSRYFSSKEPKAQIYTLELLSDHYVSNIHSKISKAYNNYTISEIVRDIYTNYLSDKNLFIEDTGNTESLIIPNLTPLEAIKWLAKRAKQKDGNGVNYLFFETLDRSNFISLNNLSDKDTMFTYRYIPRTHDASGVENLSAGVYRINKLHFVNNFNKADNAINGFYSSKLITHDIVRKKITQYDFNGYENFMSLNHLGSFPTISSSDMEIKSADKARTSFAPHDENNNFPITTGKQLSEMTDSHVIFYPKHNQLYAKNINDLYDNKVEEWKLQRTSQIKAYDNITLIIEAAGNSFLRVGQLINVEVPSNESTDADGSSDKYLDKFLSGVYMITSIKHTFSMIQAKDGKITYNTRLEITKDALESLVVNRTREDS
tara:strand:+ start:221 stop:1636 length:1416 start_codon:yes stop_codon:yes gene_type:complete